MDISKKTMGVSTSGDYLEFDRETKKQFDRRFNGIERLLASLHQVQVDNYVDRLLEKPRYQDPLRLHKYGFKGTSQFDEDGFLQEILNRVGVANKTFVEFGVGDGLENNTLYLLHQEWKGLWIEGNEKHCRNMGELFKSDVEAGRLTLANRFINRDNLDEIISGAGFSGEIDVLSIDVDGNDYHFWEAIKCIDPRVVVIEYNVKFRPPMKWVMTYNPDHRFDKTDYCGASLKSLELLGEKKGYKLVGCGFTGANAFFVREDLVTEDKFKAPFTAENHYEPCRYQLAWRYRAGMWGGYGPHELK